MNKARCGGWKCGNGSGVIKKIKIKTYIYPASVPGPSPVPDMSTTVPKKQTQKVGQQDTSQKDDEQKKKALTFSDKIKILDYMHTHQLMQKQTTNYWQENGYQDGVSQKNISIWVKNEECIWAEVAQGGAKGAICRIRKIWFPELEEALTLWVEGCEALLQPITGLLIVVKVERLRDTLDIPGDAIRFSNRWVDKFKQCHALQQHQSHGKAGSVNLTSVKEEWMRMWKELEGWDLNNVFNADEMSFFWRSVQNNGLSMKGLPGRKLDKMRMSVLVMMNTTGTEKICLLFIVTARKLQCFGRKEGWDLGLWYFDNRKVWMTGEVFVNALEELDTKMKQTNQKILLLIDNFSGHKWHEEKITNIKVLFFSPNLTPFIQPADAGIICCLKVIFHKLVLC